MRYIDVRRVEIHLLSQKTVVVDPKYIMNIDLQHVKKRINMENSYSETQYSEKAYIRIYKEHWNKDYKDRESFRKESEEIIAQLETSDIISIKFEFEDDLPALVSTNWGSTVQRNYHVDSTGVVGYPHYAINIEPK
ncbi:hypothetical protein HOBO_238 [Bacillus phage Hobo]|uniref:Uncharacterized protein n=2 Tax=Caeruleovirus BM15 TaxID=1985178 RepID=A0A0S2MUS6_9CAUD|nr:hypothetical protein FD732_gp103 [Bacillus phage BM15]ALO79646.1 hypothetical protein BM10_242 [Bacillus phage BM15]AXQ66993.1 hypothetical protein HOBO_238 [Bacillus phage Hobo]